MSLLRNQLSGTALSSGSRSSTMVTRQRGELDDLKRALSAHKAGDLDAAVAGYGRVLARNPQNHRARYNLAVVCRDRGELERAAAEAEAAVAAAPNIAEYLCGAASIHGRGGQPELALARFSQAFALAEPAAWALGEFGEALEALGRTAEAKDVYAATLGQDPNLHSVRRRMHDLIDPEINRRFDRNIEAIERELPELYNALGKCVLTHNLVWYDDGEPDVYRDGEPAYRIGAKQFAQSEFRYFFENVFKLTNVKLDISNWTHPHAHGKAFYKAMTDFVTESGLEVAGQRKSLETYFLVIFGVGLGYHIRPLMDVSKCYSLIVLDRDIEMAYLSLYTCDWASIVDDLRSRGGTATVMLSEDPDMMAASAIDLVQMSNAGGVEGIIAYGHLTGPDMLEARQRFINERMPWVTYMGTFDDQRILFVNTLRNLLADKPRMFVPSPEPHETPIAVIGRGASLAQVMDLIDRFGDRLITISCGTALPALLNAGIMPDFHVILESTEDQLLYFGHVRDELGPLDTHILGSTTMWPGVAELFRERTYFTRVDGSTGPVFHRPNDVWLTDAFPQVSNAGLSLACRMGARDIYLLGVDLGAPLPGEAKGEVPWPERVGQHDNREYRLEVKGNLTERYLTSPDFQFTMLFFERLAFDAKGSTIYNVGDGVFIRNTVPMSTDDFRARLAGMAATAEHKAHNLRRVVGGFNHYDMARDFPQDRYEVLCQLVRETAATLIDIVDSESLATGWFMKRTQDVIFGSWDVTREQLFIRGFFQGTIHYFLCVGDYYARRLRSETDLEAFTARYREEYRRQIAEMAEDLVGVLSSVVTLEPPELIRPPEWIYQ